MIGQTISHYKIIRQLGAGGMGAVYQAEDIKLKRMIALKFLPSVSTFDSQAKARFIQEAQAASALDHPNICTIHEIDETPDGQLFIAMACYEGETLEERIARGPLQLSAAVDIAFQVAAGLGRAHDQGIVHRDTKPGNIFLTDDGQVKILDFGIAKLEGQKNLTMANSIVGTINYMAPEQTCGEEIDGRTDIWSLGTVFYQMITGRLPFQGETAASAINAILNTEFEPPSVTDPSLPPTIDAFLARCLDKSPGSRYQTMGDLSQDLKRLEGGPPFDLSATIQLAVASRSPLGNRRRWFAAGIALTLMALVIGIKPLVSKFQQMPEFQQVRIAVLPFENLGPLADESFCEGVTDVVTARLAGIAGLGVISRKSARRYGGSNKNAGTIGRELEVDYLLEATVQREIPSDSSSRQRITPQLIRVDDDTHVWAKTYDVGNESAFHVQTTIAERVAFELGITLLAPASRGSSDRIWSRELYLEQVIQSLEAALGIGNQNPKNQAIVRGHFDLAVRSLIAMGLLNPDHGNGDDLARAFTAIHSELNTTRTSQEVYGAYIKNYNANDETFPVPGEFDLEVELGLIMNEFGVDATQSPLPPTLLAQVEKKMALLTGKWRSFTQSALARSGEYLPMIRQELRRRNLPEVLACIPFSESGYNPNSESSLGAVGLWQFMPGTSRDYGLRVEPGGIDQRRDPLLATVAAIEYLDYLLGVFGANQFMSAIAAYNSGVGGLNRCLQSQGDWRSPWRYWNLVESDVSCLAQETKDYLPLFLACAVVLQRPDAFELTGEQ